MVATNVFPQLIISDKEERGKYKIWGKNKRDESFIYEKATTCFFSREATSREDQVFKLLNI